MQDVPRLPYRLPELIAADPALPVFLVEGEKDADRLAANGLVATTNSEGAGKFKAELAPHFAGRRVVIIPDNDKPGQDHADDVAKKLDGVATAVVILALPGLGPKGDVSDWMAQGGSAFDLQQLAEQALHRPAEAFDLADLTQWARTVPTPKAFFMAPFIPREDVVIVTGDGGTNKSTLALQLSACAVAGKRMLGLDVAAGPALYVTAEDDNRENHWRLFKIAAAIGTTIEQLAPRLHIVSLRGKLNNEIATFDHEGKLQPTPTYRLLRATIQQTGATLLTLDNVAHLFAGNENDRSQVTAFINLLYQLCGDFGVTILLIAHRNKVGDSYSGSTAWLNAVRSQVLLERGEEGDPDSRRLSLGKANYARPGEQVNFRWHDFALKQDSDLPPSAVAEIREAAGFAAENMAFLRCLEKATADQRSVSHVKGSNYAPTIFAGMIEAGGVKQPAFARAMERLIHLRTISLDRPLGQGQNRHWKHGIKLTSECANPPAPTPCADPRQPPSQVVDVAAPALRAPTPLYTTYKGAAAQAAAPSSDATEKRAPIFTAEHPNGRPRGGQILAPGETGDEPVPGWEGL